MTSISPWRLQRSSGDYETVEPALPSAVQSTSPREGWTPRLRYTLVGVVAALVCCSPACAPATGGIEAAKESGTPTRGGRLVATFRSEPVTFNRLAATGAAEELFARLTQGRLVRLNRVSHQIEPWLAREWTTSATGLSWTLRLREDVTFSDGRPFTSADVLFSVRAMYDPRVASALADSFLIGGKPLRARALDPATVVIDLPEPYGPGIGILDSLPIFPRHKLHDALEAGTFKNAWNLATPLSDIVGLGPFVPREYLAGQRLVLARNPKYWRRDDEGAALPYLDEIELQFVADANAESLRFQAGEVDLVTDYVRPEDLVSFQRMAEEQQTQLVEAGVSISPDALIFNLAPRARAAQLRPWLYREEFRRAVSYAVDRQWMVNNLYFGAAAPIFGPVTSGYGEWYVSDLPRTDYDLTRARTLFASAGLADRDGDGLLDDSEGKPARFSILTQKSALRERATTMIQDQLQKVGLSVDVVALETGAMVDRWKKGESDTLFFYLLYDALDPARHLEFWMSSGGFHLWHPNQSKPATPWEAEIDAHMRRVSSSMDPTERKRAFEAAQRQLAAHAPLLYFVAPSVIVPMSSRVRGAMPTVLPAPVLWNAEQVYLNAPSRPPSPR
jgi:peptide/nickel transport system substrate-binding protein